MKLSLPKYWRPATIPFSTKLSEISLNYLNSQAEKYGVTKLLWLNLLLSKMAKDGRSFDPRLLKPTEEELVAVGLQSLTKEAREQKKSVNYATVDRRRPRRPRKQTSF
jgi:hypothetical protein